MQNTDLASTKVIALGDGGSSALNRIIETCGSRVTWIAANTARDSLLKSHAKTRVLMGEAVTHGLGAGGSSALGQRAAEASTDELYEVLYPARRVLIIGAMGGGTGSGAAPVIARIARELNAETIGIVSQPFTFEGSPRLQIAESSIELLQKWMDDLVVIPGDRLLALAEKQSMEQAFALSSGALAWQTIGRLAL